MEQAREEYFGNEVIAVKKQKQVLFGAKKVKPLERQSYARQQ